MRPILKPPVTSRGPPGPPGSQSGRGLPKPPVVSEGLQASRGDLLQVREGIADVGAEDFASDEKTRNQKELQTPSAGLHTPLILSPPCVHRNK